MGNTLRRCRPIIIRRSPWATCRALIDHDYQRSVLARRAGERGECDEVGVTDPTLTLSPADVIAIDERATERLLVYAFTDACERMAEEESVLVCDGEVG